MEAPTRVQLPDGSIGEFPEGMSQDQIQSVLTKQFPTQAPDTRNSMQRSFDTETQTNPKEPLLQTGLKSVVGGAGSMFVHPLKESFRERRTDSYHHADAPLRLCRRWLMQQSRTTKKAACLMPR